MNKPIGGRGKKAPYETTHVRIPVDLKAQVEKLVEDYRNNGLVIPEEIHQQSTDNESINYRQFVDSMIDEFKKNGMYFDQDEKRKARLTLCINEDDAFESARNFIKASRTKKTLAGQLLSRIYGTAIDDPRLD
jgi:hypothetical protein